MAVNRQIYISCFKIGVFKYFTHMVYKNMISFMSELHCLLNMSLVLIVRCLSGFVKK